MILLPPRFSTAFKSPAQLSHTTGARDEIAGRRIPRQVVDQDLSILVRYEFVGARNELWRLNDGDEAPRRIRSMGRYR